jgi:hypothetical protein
MGFGWVSYGKLRPMRIRWGVSSPARYDIAKWRKPDIAAWKRATCSLPKVEADRLRRLNYPRVLDEYGIDRRPLHRS